MPPGGIVFVEVTVVERRHKQAPVDSGSFQDVAVETHIITLSRIRHGPKQSSIRPEYSVW